MYLFKYFFYILKHKWFYFLEAMKVGLYLSAFTHDLSKFLPSEFFAYAYRFHSGKKLTRDTSMVWRVAMLYHFNRNKHHWNYWILTDEPVPMPLKYVRQMMCDWKAMARVKGDSAMKFYGNNKLGMLLHEETEKHISEMLYP